MRYTTLLLDLDHTLFDFDASETTASSAALTRYGVDTCWYAPSSAEASVTPTYRVEHLSEILDVVRD